MVELTETENELLNEFVKTAKSMGETNITTIQDNKQCGVFLKDGTDIPCLAAYQDELGNWSVLERKELVVKNYLASEVL